MVHSSSFTSHFGFFLLFIELWHLGDMFDEKCSVPLKPEILVLYYTVDFASMLVVRVMNHSVLTGSGRLKILLHHDLGIYVITFNEACCSVSPQHM